MSRYKGRLELEGEAHARAMAQLLEQFPELDPEDPYFIDTLEGMTDFRPAVTAIVEHYRRLLADAAGLRAQAEAYAADLIERAKRYETKADVTKNRLERVLVAVGGGKMEEPSFTLSLRQNQPPVEVFDISFLPEAYLRPPPPREPDKIEIRKALNDPERREEVELAARFGNSPPSLQIKLK